MSESELEAAIRVAHENALREWARKAAMEIDAEVLRDFYQRKDPRNQSGKE